MEPSTVCTCGHVFDEHRQDDEDIHECLVEGCECPLFEEDED